MAQANENTQNLRYKTREEVEQFIFQSPQAFREALEQNPEMRQNFQVLLQAWNPADIMSVSWFLQADPAKSPINGQKILIENVAKDFSEWANKEAMLLHTNRYHELSSFEQFHREREKMRMELKRHDGMENNQDKNEKELAAEEERKKHAQDIQNQLNILMKIGVEQLKEILAEEYENISISDAKWRRMLTRLVPTKMYPGFSEKELAGVGMLMLGNSDDVMRKILAAALEHEEFKKALLRHGVDVADITAENLPKVYGAVSQIAVNEEVPGFTENTLRTFLDEKSQRVLEAAQNINHATDMTHEERQNLQEELLSNSSVTLNYENSIKQYASVTNNDYGIVKNTTNGNSTYVVNEQQMRMYNRIKNETMNREHRGGSTNDFYWDFKKKGYIDENGKVTKPAEFAAALESEINNMRRYQGVSDDKLKDLENMLNEVKASASDTPKPSSYGEWLRNTYGVSNSGMSGAFSNLSNKVRIPDVAKPKTEVENPPPNKIVQNATPSDEKKQIPPSSHKPEPKHHHESVHNPKSNVATHAVKHQEQRLAQNVPNAGGGDFG